MRHSFRLLLVLWLLCGASALHAQPDTTRAADTFDFDRPGEDTLREGRVMREGIPFRADIGVQGRMGTPLSGRLQLMLGGEVLQVSLFSFAVTGGRDSLGTFISLNPAFSLGAYLGQFVHPLLGLIILIPQALPNLSLEVPIIKSRLGITLGERTDYFLKNNVFRIHTETQTGLRFHAPGLMVEALYVIPHTSSVMEHRPYFGVGVHTVLSAP